MRCIKAVSIVLAMTSALGASRAGAHDHRPPPNPVLVVDSERQRGRPVHVSWLERIDDDECEFSDGTSSLTFPRPLRLDEASVAAILLKKKAPPLEWEVRAWTKVDAAGHPVGAGEVVPSAVVHEPSSTQRRAPWSVQFFAPGRTRHLYVRLDVYWADEENCSAVPDLGSQSGSWTYHLKTVP